MQSQIMETHMDSNIIIRAEMLETGILSLTLNRPNQLNALSLETLQILSEHLKRAKSDKTIKALLLSGEGKAFCAGADINQLQKLTGTNGFEFAQFGQSVMNQLESLGKPSVAAIHGYALGGGCELAMAATLRIATNNAIFGQPEIKLGVIPGFGGTQRLARLVGKGRALELCLTGRRFTAQEAFNWGMVNELAEDATLHERAIALLKTLTQQSPVAIESILAAINQGIELPQHDGLNLEAAYFGICCTTQDKTEGVNAFLEKRPAKFSGE